MKNVAIIAALPGELKPLVRGWERRGQNLWAGRVGDCEAVAVAGGMGARAAERAVERVLAEATPDALVSYGWAGALTCAVKAGAVCVISEVIEDGSGERFATASRDGYRLITLDHVARADEKRALAQKHQAVLVDMEAATVARMALARGLPFYCFKGISDGYADRLPDFNRFVDTERGELKMRSLVAYAAVRPVYWGSLWRMGKNSGVAADGLVELVKGSLTQA